MKILLTGATGFVGEALAQYLNIHGYAITAAVRRLSDRLPAIVRQIPIDNPLSNTDWTYALHGVDTVIHLAARVHIMYDKATNPMDAFRAINTTGTLNLARQAAVAGARRLIFISSIKVNGEETSPGQSFTADEMPAPKDPYSISKHEAELGLRKLASETYMDVVIIRPPLIYGPRVRGNFHSMMRWLSRGIPLPLGAIKNQRSLLALDNLVDLIVTCLTHPVAANQTFLAADGEDLSTTELLYRIGLALGRPARLISVPALLLEAGATLFRRRDMAQRLCGSLQVDISKTRTLLGWEPPISVDEGLRRTAEDFVNNKNF